MTKGMEGFRAMGALMEPGNVKVIGVTPNLAGGFGFAGVVCFIGKGRGMNAYGAPVPIWVYGPCNSESYQPNKPAVRAPTAEEEAATTEALERYKRRNPTSR
jgi:hypothetical protein